MTGVSDAAPGLPSPGAAPPPSPTAPAAAGRPTRAPEPATPALPRTLRLPPHRSFVPRGPSSRLFGLDPRTALVVDDLPPPLASMLDELAAPMDRVETLARAAGRGADVHAADDLLRQLV